MIFIGIILGIIIAFLCIFLYDKIQSKKINLPAKFKIEQKNVANHLKEKKDAREKEMTEEIERFLETKKVLAAQNIEHLEKSYSEKSKSLENQYEKLKSDLDEDYEEKRKSIIQMEQNEQQEHIRRNSQLIAKAQSSYESQLKEITEDFEQQKQEKSKSFLEFSKEIDSKKEKLQNEIQVYEDQQAKIIARFKQDDEVRAQRDFYRIKITSEAIQDIHKLKNLAFNFNNPQVIYKLIWEVYYKSLMENLFKKILGDNAKNGGIYKITNITNEKVYIGRTTSFLERMRTHSKRGCGIDRIKGLLYDAMFEEGLENFTFEIVEVCSKEEQAQREKYWISFYKSNEYGYNLNTGG